MATLEDAIEIAVRAHRGQTDKAGAPYVLHVLRVMLKMPDEAAMTAAALHDVVEDTPRTLDDLRAAGFSEAVVEAVDALTRRKGETYEAFVRRAGRNPLARLVKRADLEDNMDLRRIAHPTEKDFARLRRYRKAWELLRD
jgi:(p)ppGpp synthase/HD superfamily hydrolase